ncbi:hypothetical protein O9929_10165 [Vibrio lentus]|nr:hypothetical protein [Vibrio lentus]
MVPNDRDITAQELADTKESNRHNVCTVGRLRKMSGGRHRLPQRAYCYDQLLWGAAEPLRRTLRIILAEKA